MGAVRRAWVACLVLLAGLPLSFAGRALVAASSPNVVLITIDTLRADHVGCYGYRPAHTPTLDALARDGVLFRTAVTAVPLTLPSHCSILTGTYPPTHGVRDNLGYLLAPQPTLASLLRARGYATGAFVGAYVLDRSRGLDPGFDVYSSPFHARSPFGNTPVTNIEYLRRPGEAVIADACAWLGKPRRGSFFLWVHLYDPHTPYDPPARFRALARTPYDGAIAYADYAVAKLIGYLKAHGWYEGTLIVATSDHGESFGEHGEYAHGYFIYDTTLLVPLIIKPPRGFPVGAHRVTRQVRSVDIAPTILECAGAPIPSRMEGASLAVLMRGLPDALAMRAAYSESYYAQEFGWSPLRSLREQGFKYVDAPKPELYDLTRDPRELHNLYASDQTDAHKLKANLDGLLARFTPAKPAHAPATTPADAELLRSLGYVATSPPVRSTSQAALPDPKDKIAEYRELSHATEAAYHGDCRRAAFALTSLTAQDPSLFAAQLLLGKCRVASGDYEGGSWALESAVRLRRADPEAVFWRAVCDYDRGRLDSALAGFDQIVQTHPNEPFPHLYRGLIDQRNGRAEDALTEFQTCVRLAPELEEARYKLGYTLAKLGRYGEAIAEFKKVVALDSHNAGAHFDLGLAYARSGDAASARTEFAAACNLQAEFCRHAQP